MLSVIGVSVVGIIVAGCGDNLGAPRLVTRATPVVPPQELVFDADNQPIALLHADIRRRIARLEPDGFQTIPGTELLDVHGLGTDRDGTPLFTVTGADPGSSALVQLRPDHTFVQLGGRIASASAVQPLESQAGTRFVLTVDGGRRLPAGAQRWEFAPTLSQLTRGPGGEIYAMGTQGVVRVAGGDDVVTVLLPCAEFPVSCSRMTFAGVDRDERLYFVVGGQPELFVLDPGASELRTLTLPGVHELGAARAAPDFVAVEAVVVTEDGARHSTLFTRGLGDRRFRQVDQTARPELAAPVLAVDREGTMYVADGDWLGTIERAGAVAE